jgi:hypothetical protein
MCLYLFLVGQLLPHIQILLPHVPVALVFLFLVFKFDLTLPFSHGERGESTRAAPVYAFACLHAPNIHVGFASSLPVGLMRRLIHPWTVFPATCLIVHYAVHLEPLLMGNSPVAAHSCERMSLHLPGLRHKLQALHLRPRWHLPRRKLGRRQDLGYLEGVLALAFRCLVLMYKVAICHPST